MKQISYAKLSEQINKNTGLVKCLNVIDKAITFITVGLYALLLGYLFLLKDINTLYMTILVPGVSFAIVSLYRKKVSMPRPYEVYEFTPAISKETVGKSFPSRHVFSIFIIATTYMYVMPDVAPFIYILGLLLAVIRVVGGVHFVKDVVAGATLGLLCGVFGFSMLIFL